MADTKSTMVSLNDVSFEVVEGTGKNSGKPYTALRITVEHNGKTYRSPLVTFINEITQK